MQRFERVFEEAERSALDARVEVSTVLLGALCALVGKALEAGQGAGHAAEALEARAASSRPRSSQAARRRAWPRWYRP